MKISRWEILLKQARAISRKSGISVLILACFGGFASYAQEQIIDPQARDAEEPPKSILFPAGVPAPYFPNDSEIVDRAEDRLNNLPGLSNDPQNAQPFEQEVISQSEEQDDTAYGTLSQSMGGMAKNIWQPSDIAKIQMLMNVLNLPMRSPAMDAIARKLLLSTATSPTGIPIIDGDTDPDELDNRRFNRRNTSFDEDLLKQFINMRLRELIERGNLEDLVLYIQNLPEQMLNPKQQNAEILMLGGDFIGACQMSQQIQSSFTDSQNRNNRFPSNSITQDNELSGDDKFWLKMQAFCRVLQEDNVGAQIALDMLNEQGNIDFVFNDLLGRLMEPPETRGTFFSGGLTSLEPINYAIWTFLDQPIDANLIEASDPLIISALVINPNMPAENRFQAAARSYLFGGVTANALRNIYDLQEFSIAEYNSAVRMAEFDDRPLADALLYQAASKQADDVEKAQILEAIWERARESTDIPRKAALNSETLKSISPSTRLINHAHHISRGLILAGEKDSAIGWYDFARRAAAGGDAEATRALINIWPLAMLASEPGDIPWSDSILNLWWNGQMVLSPENKDAKATLFYALAEAFGYAVADDKWAELITENHMAGIQSIPLAVWREMIRAVGENKPGEAVLLSLIAMGQDGPGSLDASGLSAVVRLLRSVGLEQEARSVAIEALVANGF